MTSLSGYSPARWLKPIWSWSFVDSPSGSSCGQQVRINSAIYESIILESSFKWSSDAKSLIELQCVQSANQGRQETKQNIPCCFVTFVLFIVAVVVGGNAGAYHPFTVVRNICRQWSKVRRTATPRRILGLVGQRKSEKWPFDVHVHVFTSAGCHSLIVYPSRARVESF